MGSGSPALLLVHGWGGDVSVWSEQVPVFSKNHRVVTLDLAGHGTSSSEREARPIVAVADHLGLGQVVLVGHSMGSPVALEAALRLGSRVSAVVHVNAFGELDQKLDQATIDGFRDDYQASIHEWVRTSLFIEYSDAGLANRIAADMA